MPVNVIILNKSILCCNEVFLFQYGSRCYSDLKAKINDHTCVRLDLSIIDGKIRRTWHQQVTEFVEILTDQVVWKQCGKNFVEQIEIKKWKHERDIDSVMWMLLLFIFDA
jgi:hypothetical protein